MTLLRDIAYVRSGDKGDIVSVGVMAKAPDLYDPMLKAVEPERVRALLGDWVQGPVEVHRMDNIHTVIVTLHGALGGGATKTLRLDQTAKALGNALLRLETDG